MANRPRLPFGLFFILAIVGLMILANQVSTPPRPARLSYTEFESKVEAGQVKEVVLEESKRLIGWEKEGEQTFEVYLPDSPELVKSLAERLAASQVKLTVKPPPPPWLVNYLPYVLALGVFLGLWWLLIRQAQSGSAQALSFGKSRAKILTEDRPKASFADVAGAEEAKEELREVVDFLKDAKKFQALGARVPKGVMLLGPPGTGKTLLARAVAGEAKVPFFHISGSDFVEMFVGVGAARVRDLFDQAKRNAPCLIFIDELDAVGRQRGTGLGGGHDEREQTLNQLLVEMDGFDPNQGVMVIAATNRPDVLDPALLRPGRFDRHIVVDKPDVNGRRAILEVHAKGKPFEKDVDWEVIARGTPGFSGADLANLINEAALLAGRRDKKKIDMQDLEEAKERVVAGPERKSRLISEKEKEIIAYHEAGHALVAKLLPGADPVHKISILPRGMALGYTMQLPVQDRYLMTRDELVNHITVMLGGRTAEETVFNDITTGAHDDLERATELARRMVCEYGMSERLGPITLGRKQEQVFLGKSLFEDRNYSEEVAAVIDEEVRSILDHCHEQATRLLAEHRDKLDRLARTLKEKESLEREELDRFFKEMFPPDSAAPASGDGRGAGRQETVSSA